MKSITDSFQPCRVQPNEFGNNDGIIRNTEVGQPDLMSMPPGSPVVTGCDQWETRRRVGFLCRGLNEFCVHLRYISTI